MKWYYHLGRWIGILSGWPIQLLYFRRKLHYENKAVQGRFVKGGALIISNHYCPVDVVVNNFVLFPRMLYVVASEHAFKNKGMQLGMRFFGGIETDRRIKGMSFIHQAAELLQKGQLVQIFPEGHNSYDGKIHPFYPSYLLLALMGGVPIIPVVLDGNYTFKKRQHVLIGEPIDIAAYFPGGKYTQADLERVNEQIYQHMLALKQDLDERIAASR